MKRLMSYCLAFLLLAVLVLGAFPAMAASGADLVITNLTFSGNGQVTPGSRVTATVTVKNQGGADAAAVAVTLNKVYHENGAPQVRSVVTFPKKGKLRAGESVTIESAAWAAETGDYMLAAVVNESREVAESSYKNNTIQRNLRVASNRVEPAYNDMKTILQKAGMTDLIFNDDFNDPNSVDNSKSKKMGYKWYITRPYGAPDLEAGDYAVENGIMTVKNTIPTYNYGLGTVDMDSYEGFTFTTGYLEVRVRVPRPRENTETEKGVPAIWALPTEKLFDNSRHWVELDWMEYWGDNYYTVCLHEIKSKADGSKEMWYTNGSTAYSGLNDGEWHVMGWLWQDGLFITYYDGVEKKRIAYEADSFPDPMYDLKEGMMDVGAFVLMDSQHMPIIIGGSQDNPMELDYVRVWDGDTNGTYDPATDVEEEPPVTVDPLTAEEFLYNYTTDEYGDVITTVTAENCASVLEGASVWSTLSATLKAEINAKLKNNGQPTFDAMLAKARAVSATTAKPNGATTQNKTTKVTKTTVAVKTTKATATKTNTATSVTVAATDGAGETTETLTEQTAVQDPDETLSTTVQDGDTQPTTVANANGEQQPQSKALPILLTVAGVLVLGGAVVAVLWWYKRKQSK